MSQSQYTITERLDASTPSDNDPIAQAMPRHSGMFDLRCGGAIVFGSNKLDHLRKQQAKANTQAVLDNAFTVEWKI